jgi:hypothetical protein
MDAKDLHSKLRDLGWIPVGGDRSVTSRAWRLISDDRPHPITIRVPRTDFVNLRAAQRLLRRATKLALR